MIILPEGSKKIFEYFYEGPNKGKFSKIEIDRQMTQCIYMKQREIFIAFSNRNIILYHRYEIIDRFDEATFHLYNKSIRVFETTLTYLSSKKSIKVIPHFKFAPLEEQERIFEIQVPVHSDISDHQILANEKIIISGNKGFLGLYRNSGAILSTIRLNCHALSAIDLSLDHKHVAVSLWASEGHQIIQILKIDGGNNLTKIAKWEDKGFRHSFYDLDFKILLKGFFLLTAATLHEPYKIFTFAFDKRGSKLVKIGDGVAGGYERASHLISCHKQRVVVTGGWNNKISILRYNFG